MKTQATKSLVNIEIPAPEFGLIQVTAKGITPLLSHNFSKESLQKIKDTEGKKAKHAKGARDTDKEYIDSLYPLPGGKYGIPSTAFKKAAVSACCMVDGMTMTLTSKAFFIMEEYLEIKSKKGPKKREDRVSVGGFGKGSATMRYRGEFPDWEATMTIRYNAAIITKEQIINLLQLAGSHIGVGDWRLESGKGTGGFGAFTVTIK